MLIWNEYHEQGLQIVAYGPENEKSTWKAAAEHDEANHWLQASHLQRDDATIHMIIKA